MQAFLPYLREQCSTAAVEKAVLVESTFFAGIVAVVVDARLEVPAQRHGVASLRTSGLDIGHFRRHPNSDETFGDVPSVEIAADNAENIHGIAVVAVAAGNTVLSRHEPNLEFVDFLDRSLAEVHHPLVAAAVASVADGIAEDCIPDNAANVRNQHSVDSVVVVAVAVEETRDLTCPFVAETQRATADPC